MIYVFSVTMMLSSAIIFLVELITAKILLPQYGGSTQVWATCMLFYQVVLTMGYLYAHYAMTYLKHKISVVFQLVFVGCIFYFLPIEISGNMDGLQDKDPLLGLLVFLLKGIGIPFFVFSTTSSVIQKWFERSDIKGSKDPYFLYGISNLGSILALIAYPLWIEPNFSINLQNTLVLSLYCLFFILMLVAGIYSFLASRKNVDAEAAPQPGPQATSLVIPATPIPIQKKLKWLLLAFIPSGLMISVTSYLSQELAISPNPFLWSVPLLIYLLTFIIAFSRRPLLTPRIVYKIFSIFMIFIPISLLFFPANIIIAGIHFITLFIIGIMSHGQLAEDRPPVQNLTEFYILLSVGGALGGIFNSLIAPLLFNQVLEYSILLILSCLIIPYKWEKPFLKNIKKTDVIIPLVIAIFTFTFALKNWSDALFVMLFFLIVMRFLIDKYPIRFALTLSVLFISASLFQGLNGEILWKGRDFYGTYKVMSDPVKKRHALIHGNILHGMQRKDANEYEPTTYYSRRGPMGQFFESVKERSGQWQVGLVGLGIGSSLAYKEENQSWTLYEISPTVLEIAQNSQYFTFLHKFEAKVILGDARLSMKFAKEHDYNLIIIDAYSSDVIPVHLLTREAFELYLDKLTPDGGILINVSNRVYNLVPVLAGIAGDLGLSMLEQTYKIDKNIDSSDTPSQWCVLTKNRELFNLLKRNTNWKEVSNNSKFPVWTDRYSSLLRILK